MAIGVALGLIFGTMMNQTGAGLAIGIAVGMGIGSMADRRAKKQDDTN